MNNTRKIDFKIIEEIDRAFLEKILDRKNKEYTIIIPKYLIDAFGIELVAEKMKTPISLFKKLLVNKSFEGERSGRTLKALYADFLTNGVFSSRIMESDEYAISLFIISIANSPVLKFTKVAYGENIIKTLMNKFDFVEKDILNLMEKWDPSRKSLRESALEEKHHIASKEYSHLDYDDHTTLITRRAHDRFAIARKVKRRGFINFHSKYWIDKSGLVIKETPAGELKSVKKHIRVNNYGKKSYAVSIDSKLIYIPKLLATHFIPNPNEYKYVRHTPKEEGTFLLDEIEWIPSPRYKSKNV